MQKRSYVHWRVYFSTVKDIKVIIKHLNKIADMSVPDTPKQILMSNRCFPRMYVTCTRFTRSINTINTHFQFMLNLCDNKM